MSNCARDLVVAIGKERRTAKARADAKTGELRAAVRAAAREGVNEVDLAHLSGVTRVTVRKWLGKDGGLA